MIKIILPKKDEEGISYFSYSQYTTWKKSKKEYIKSYFLGDRFEGNAYTEFGSLIGNALEKGDFEAFDTRETALLESVTRLDEFEKKVKLNFGDFYVVGYIDTNDKDLTLIVDYKTGDLNKEEVYEADSYDQLAVYAAALEQEFGKLPKKAVVELIERTGNAYKGEPLMLGSNVVTIEQDISPKRIEKVKKDILKAAKDVSAYYKVFEKLDAVDV